ncbi:MAG: 4a-hydroxytetrahydrobiopterin dehydratase [Chlorobium sp.]|nr:4a-hydroxytetrahydrobiopterin dehydratase [Chlorobium sp.]MCW8815311.1 4a-hydroxytetrahydrobiopterin dehydratase [Chlorobium sp.]MCW8819131.1 4a-hydroxytetrahydrobiopterin dehydratase [Ignavibacteriaceae bacterium]
MEKLAEGVVEEKARQLAGWEVTLAEGGNRLVRLFTFEDFVSAMAFSVKVGMIAEKADHHPAVLVEWGKVTVTWWSHSLGGLSEKDFEMAGRTSGLYEV